MFIERLLNQGNAPLLEQWLRSPPPRHQLIAENVVNISTPDYRQKDLSLEQVPGDARRAHRGQRREAGPGEVGFDDIDAELEEPERGILFHDGNNRRWNN